VVIRSPSNTAEYENRISELEQALAACQQEQESYRTERSHFELFTDAIADHALIVLNLDGCVRRWNSGAERLMGWSAGEIVGRPFAVFFTPEDLAKDAPRHELDTATKNGISEDERWHVRRDGTRFWGSGSLSTVRNKAGELLGFTKVIRDRTGYIEAERLLRQSEERLRLFIENVTDYALFQVDKDARISSWNTGAARTFGYKEEAILGTPMRLLYLPEEAANGDAEKDLELAGENGRFEDARWLVRKDGTKLFARWVTTPMWDEEGSLRGYAKVLRDETERRENEQQLRNNLEEKHALLQEIHHRVKNNLQVITSLLSIQAARMENPEVSAVLADTETRVRAIAALHETLYSSQDLASIEFGTYLKQLVGDLVSFYGVERERLEVQIEATDLVVDIGQAIPLGLIVNELVTNVLKHAFPDSQAGRLEVKLKYLRDSVDPGKGQTLDDGLGQLAIRDNGVGLPRAIKFKETPSMGLHLINLLVEQLRGELKVAADEGTAVTITFPLSTPVAGFDGYGSDSYR
jgi:PAS domain S-box-containing protein